MNNSNTLNLAKLPANVQQQVIDYYDYLVMKYASVEQAKNTFSQNADDGLFLQQYIKPMRKQTDIADIVREQNYHGVDKEKMYGITQTINIPQSTDELLLML